MSGWKYTCTMKVAIEWEAIDKDGVEKGEELCTGVQKGMVR